MSLPLSIEIPVAQQRGRDQSESVKPANEGGTA